MKVWLNARDMTPLHLMDRRFAGGSNKNEPQPRLWCPATRVLEHREAEANRVAADAAKRAGRMSSAPSGARHWRTGFDSIDVRAAFSRGLQHAYGTIDAVGCVTRRSMRTQGKSMRADGPSTSQRVQTVVK